jgi:hypothetical protein
VIDSDSKLLRELLVRGLRVFNQSDGDGATALHRYLFIFFDNLEQQKLAK